MFFRRRRALTPTTALPTLCTIYSRKCARSGTVEVLRPPSFMPKQSLIIIWVYLDQNFPEVFAVEVDIKWRIGLCRFTRGAVSAFGGFVY
jgi:hypothetical protein